jgi:hypothetical protein
MEFLVIIVATESSLLLHAIHDSFYQAELTENHPLLYSGFNNPYQKSAKQETSSLFMNSIL